MSERKIPFPYTLIVMTIVCYLFWVAVFAVLS